MFHHRLLISLLFLLASDVAFGGEEIRNWPAPPTWAATGPNGIRPISTLSDISPPLPFVSITPCRQYDSRNSAPLANGVNLVLPLTGAPCGIPAAAAAVSLNITVFDITGAGSNGVFKLGTAVPPTTAWINYPPTETQRGNAGVAPLAGGGSIVVQVAQGAGSVDFTVDVNGYYASTFANAATNFTITTSKSGQAQPSILGQNQSTGCQFDCGIEGTTASTIAGYGVSGRALGTTGTNYGVFGRTNSNSNDTAGVFGLDKSGPNVTVAYASAGVRGHSVSGYGVLGIGLAVQINGGTGVAGSGVNPDGTEFGYGLLAWSTLGAFYGVYSGGNFGGSGAKYFVEPHPTDASKVIRYVSLEGPEAGTYFRGRARFQKGVATIDVPEDFRMVTDSEGLSIQVTPIGGMAMVGVVRIDLDQIIVQGSRDLEFFYTVNGVRRTHKDLKPIGPGSEFMPRSADAKIPGYLTDAQKAMLISNGTYRKDGTVNLETARQLGWDKVWEEREKLAPPE